MRSLILFTILLAAPLHAQLLNWGVKGGFPMTDAFHSAVTLQPSSQHWTVGPAVELNLPFGLGVEANALYRKVGVANASSLYESSSWSFPLLAKYKFPGSLARLYAVGGYSFRRISDIPSLWDNTSAGFVLGGGIRYNLGLIKISPEFRWTRYGTGSNPATNLFGPAQNQADFLVGLTF
ncbi:MAG: outer membrane beta-barrel protein [Acidobacteria bacterium]|nr:outer membrane beta-barrel protein [Acidobacteriota bacterium]